jgi:hypothetical protein
MWHTRTMPKRISRPSDVNQAAHLMVERSTAEPEIVPPAKTSRSEISRIMAEMGRKGGKIGGKRRLKTMTKAERSKIATKAAKARWKKDKR